LAIADESSKKEYSVDELEDDFYENEYDRIMKLYNEFI